MSLRFSKNRCHADTVTMRRCSLCCPLPWSTTPGFVSDAQVSEGSGVTSGTPQGGQSGQATWETETRVPALAPEGSAAPERTLPPRRAGLASVKVLPEGAVPTPAGTSPRSADHAPTLAWPLPSVPPCRSCASSPPPSPVGRDRKGPLRGTPGCVANPFACVRVTFNYSLDAELSVPQLQTNEMPRSLQIGDYRVRRVAPRSIWTALQL